MNTRKVSLYTTNIVALLFIGITLLSCESIELDLAENPNQLKPEQSNPDLFLNSIQVDFGKVVERFGAIGGQVTRIDYMNGRNYQNTYSPATFDGMWSGAFQSSGIEFNDRFGHAQTFNGILADIRALTPIAERDELYHHIGITQVIEAYTIVTLVDFFGDIPYSQALQGATNLNPEPDSGVSIYQAALTLLENAITNFEKDVINEPVNDFYYNGNWNNWIKAANTIRMKIYLQQRLVDNTAIDKFNAIVAEDNFIKTQSEDFQFQWGTNVIQPDNRHPRYANNFEGDGADEYMSNWMLNKMATSDDPRRRYYYYRQTNAVPGAELPPNEETLSCSLESAPQHYIDGGFTFCFLDSGYWGRDHGDDDGIPPDGFLRTNFGVYPAAGRFDDNSFEGTSQGDGGQGAGITPILLSSWVDFMIAETALFTGDEGAARMALEEAMNKSITKVTGFGMLDSSANLSVAPDSAAITTFTESILTEYDNAMTAGKWDVIAEQYWVALFGNGIDAYNFYRRTGYPTTLQPNIEPSPGKFIRSFFYPAVLVTNNASVTQKENTDQKVFWDNNPDSPNFPVAN